MADVDRSVSALGRRIIVEWLAKNGLAEDGTSGRARDATAASGRAMTEFVISAQEAGERFDDLLARAIRGETVVITHDGRPVAQLTGLLSARLEEGSAEEAGDELYTDEDNRPRGTPKGMR